MREKAFVVYKETDHSKFRKLDGNRDVTSTRVNKIIASIDKVGVIPSPIIVNENMEVIDGQARVDALRKLNLPVYYLMIPGIGLEECTNMNINQTNWSLKDYINSFASTGNQSYKYLQIITVKYNKLPIRVLITNVTGSYSYALKSCHSGEHGFGALVKSGKFECNEETYVHACEILDYVMEIEPDVSKVGGNKEMYYLAISFCYGRKLVNTERLKNKIAEQHNMLPPVANMEQAFNELERIYNYKARKGQIVYLAHEYQKYLDNREK